MRIRTFRGFLCWLIRRHAWEKTSRYGYKRCRRCGVRAFNYFG